MQCATQRSFDRFCSIIDKYICLSHGLPPPDTDSKSFEEPLPKYNLQFKPSYSTPRQSLETSKSLECSTSVNGLKDLDFSKEVQELLNKRKIELCLPEDYQIKEIEEDILENKSLLLHNTFSPSECSALKTSSDESQHSNSKQIKEKKSLKETSENMKQLVKGQKNLHSNEHGKNYHNNLPIKGRRKRNWAKTKKVCDIRSVPLPSDKPTPIGVSEPTGAPPPIGTPTSTGVSTPIGILAPTNKPSSTDAPVDITGGPAVTGALTNPIVLSSTGIPTPTDMPASTSSSASTDAQTSTSSPLPAQNLLDIAPNACGIVLTELLDVIFVPPVNQKNILASYMNNNNHYPLHSLAFTDRKRNEASQRLESLTNTSVTGGSCQKEPKATLKLKKRSNLFQNMSINKKAKMEHEDKNAECHKVQPEEMHSKQRAKHFLLEEMHDFSENKVMKTGEKKPRGRPRKNRTTDENSLQVVCTKKISPKSKNLHSHTQKSHVLPGNEVIDKEMCVTGKKSIQSVCTRKTSPKNRTLCSQTLSHILPENEVINEEVCKKRQRGRPRKNSTSGKNSFQAVCTKKLYPKCGNLHSYTQESNILLENKVPVITDEERMQTRSVRKGLPQRTWQSQVELPTLTKNGPTRKADETIKTGLKVLNMVKASPVKDSSCDNLYNLSVMKIAPKCSSHLSPKKICSMNEDKTVKKLTSKRRTRTEEKTEDKRIPQAQFLQNLSLTMKKPENISGSNAVASCPSKTASHVQERKISHSSSKGSFLSKSPSKQQNNSPKQNRTCEEGTLLTVSEKVQGSNESHKVIQSTLLEECHSEETSVKLPRESETEATHVSCGDDTLKQKTKGKLVLNKKLSESSGRFVFRFFSEDEERKRRNRFNLLEDSLDSDDKAPRRADNTTADQMENVTVTLDGTSSNASGTQRKVNITSNKHVEKRTTNSQNWHKCLEDDIIAGIDVTKKRHQSSDGKVAISHCKVAGKPVHLKEHKISRKDIEQDFSSIVENVTVPVLPLPCAKPPDILTIPEDSQMHIETNDNDYSPKMKDYGLESQDISKSLEEECLTSRKTAKNKRLGLQKQVDLGIQTRLNGHVAQDVHKKHPSPHPVDDSESGEELHLHSVVDSTSVSVGHRGSLRDFLKVWDTFPDSKLQSMQMESFQTSHQSIKTQKNVSSFWSIGSDEMHSDQETNASSQNSALHKKSRYGEAQHISLSSCQTSRTRLINTSSVPDYSILGGDRWVAAIKAITTPNKKPILHLASYAQIVKKTNKNKNRYGRKMS